MASTKYEVLCRYYNIDMKMPINNIVNETWVSCFDDYEKTTVDVNGELITKVKAKHSLHPNDYGHILMGDTLAAVIQKTRNQTTVTNK